MIWIFSLLWNWKRKGRNPDYLYKSFIIYIVTLYKTENRFSVRFENWISHDFEFGSQNEQQNQQVRLSLSLSLSEKNLINI